jgi:hypothetical protein
VPYLPQFVFPLVLLFGNDELAALETALTFFLWWGYSWQATFPSPPVHMLDSINLLLQHHDVRLHRHLSSLGLSAGIIGWNMISSLFTEILGKEDWLKVMDYLITHIKRPSFFLLTPIAIMRASKEIVMSCTSDAHVIQFFRSQQAYNIIEVIASISAMESTTPKKLFSAMPGTSLQHRRNEAGDEDDPIFDNYSKEYDETAKARENIAFNKGKPIFPLPTGKQYPPYDGFPEYLLDWQLQEREKAMKLNKEISNRQETLKELEWKISRIDAEHEEWMSKHQAASESEISHRIAQMESERKSMSELLDIEEAISKQKVAALAIAEKAAAEEIKMIEKLTKESEVPIRCFFFHII